MLSRTSMVRGTELKESNARSRDDQLPQQIDPFVTSFYRLGPCKVVRSSSWAVPVLGACHFCPRSCCGPASLR